MMLTPERLAQHKRSASNPMKICGNDEWRLLLAHIDAQQARVANLEAQLKLADEVQEPLLDRLAGLEQDAARYRWLRDDKAYFPEERGIVGGTELDEAIDAAMESDYGKNSW